MPARSSPAGPPPSNKTQKSIHSFFTSKPASAPGPAVGSSPLARRSRPELPAERSSPDAAVLGDDASVPLDSDEGDAVRHRSGSAESKRAREDDEDDEPQGPVKRTKRQPSAAGSAVPAANGPSSTEKGPRITERTSKYLFSTQTTSEPDDAGNADDDGDDAESRRKAKLHERFVKKLGRPDSIAEIKRRSRFVTEESAAANHDDADAAEGQDEDDVDGETAPPAKPAKTTKGRKAASKLTPMEKQVLEIKAKHPDTLLVVEVGYKFRFFGEDARVAAKELHIVCIPGKLRYDECKTASARDHRLR